jgi:hypothetical protein
MHPIEVRQVKEGRLWANRPAPHFAADDGNGTGAELLVTRRADHHARDQHGTALLHCAANLGHEAVVAVLPRHGADLPDTCHAALP